MFGNEKPIRPELALLCGVLLLVLFGYIANEAWWGLCRYRESFGLRPFPEIYYEAFEPWELSMIPVIVFAILYSAIVVILCMRSWHPSLTPEEVGERANRIARRYRIGVLLFGAAIDGYGCYRLLGAWLG